MTTLPATQQQSLFDLSPVITPQYRKGATIAERFDEWIAVNPTLYRLYVKLALEIKRRGIQHYGIGALTEVIRWEYAIRTQGSEFKINNDFRALLARKIMRDVPELDGFFSTRRIQDEDPDN